MKNIFSPKISENGDILQISDLRLGASSDITDGTGSFGYISYTLKNENINEQEKPNFSPYSEKTAALAARYDGNILTGDNSQICVRTKISFNKEHIDFEYENYGDVISEFGAYLPFNFMNRKNGFWKQQLLPSSPYNSSDDNYHFCYFTRPDGNGLLLVCNSEISAFKLDYSEYCCGHFFTGYRVLASTDRAYNFGEDRKTLKFSIYPASNYTQAIGKAAEVLGVPVMQYDRYSSYCLGTEIKAGVLGNCDKVAVRSSDGKELFCTPIDGYIKFKVDKVGNYTLSPYINNKKGIDCGIYVYEDLYKLFCKTVLSVKQNYGEVIAEKDGEEYFLPPYIEYSSQRDFNLCEHCMWAWSALVYLKENKNEKIEKDLKNFLAILLADDKRLMLDRVTLIEEEQGENIPAYSTLNSNRIQEAFNGINILLAAYDCFGDDKYLEVAVNAAVSHMRDMRKFGFIKNGVSDYTTVTAMIIPIADAARKSEKAYPEASVYLKESAVIMADYVVKRGLDFPTETAVSNETTKEIEEGSMSCSALTVLYVYFYIRQDKRYIDYAKKVLSLHEAWTVFTQYPQCFRSTLRWWETIWEGDANGPSICCGHAWTIWRAEAEFYYSLIACDTQRFINSYNAFMSNISKADADGIMYSIFRLESIVAGKWNQKAESISKNNAFGFPVKEDNTLSRYVFARAYFTIFKTSVIAGDYVFGGRLRDGVFDTECREMKYLLIDGFIGRLTVNTFTGLKIFTKQEYSVLSGNLKNGEILPKNGNIVIELKKSAQNAEGRL